MTEKKKAGRPAKAKLDLTDQNLLLAKEVLELKAKLSIVKNEREAIVTELEEKLLKKSREVIDVIDEVEVFIFQIIHHCSDVESKTGRITLHDVDYSVDMLKRILKFKFITNPRNSEI